MHPQKRTLIVVTVAVVAVAVGLFAFSRGPEGTSVTKDVEDHIGSALKESDLLLTDTRSVPPADVALPFRTALRHQVRRVARFLGVAIVTRDQATEYVIRSGVGPATIQCLVRSSGDHVISVVVRHTASASIVALRFRDALISEFPDYRILAEEKNDG